MTDKALVSIIIPTYNRASIIRGALDSALRQTYPNKQIIVVDDGSTDDTESVIRSYPEVEYVRRPNGGQAAARSTGLEHAKGAYIATLDSDDSWEPDFLSECIQTLEEEELDFVFANWNQQWADGTIVDYFETFAYLQPYLAGKTGSRILFTYPELRSLYVECCPSPSSSILIRRSSFVTAWNERMHIADDWCIQLDIVLSKETRAGLIRKKLWNKRINDDNIYDGRDYYEVLKLMYVEDTYEMLHRYAGRLSRSEVKVMQHRILENTIKMAKYSWTTKSCYSQTARKIVRGFLLNPLLFINMLWKPLRRRLKNRLSPSS